MTGLSLNKENNMHVTYVVEYDLIEIGNYIFDLILDNNLQYFVYLIEVDNDIEIINSMRLYQNNRGLNAYEFAVSHKRYKIAQLIYRKVYNKKIPKQIGEKQDMLKITSYTQNITNIR